MKRRYLVGSVGAAAAIALLPSLSTAHTAVAADGDTTYGASFPYTRYEAERGRLDGAHVVSLDESLAVDKMLESTAIEAGEQSYVELEGKGASLLKFPGMQLIFDSLFLTTELEALIFVLTEKRPRLLISRQKLRISMFKRARYLTKRKTSLQAKGLRMRASNLMRSILCSIAK